METPNKETTEQEWIRFLVWYGLLSTASNYSVTRTQEKKP